MSDLIVRRLEPDDRAALDAFLETAAATVFYRPEWHDVIRATYGHSCDYWIARTGSRIVGAFPVVDVRFPALGRKMVAMPYQMYGGLPVADDEQVSIALVRAAVARSREVRARYLEVRHRRPAPWLAELGFVTAASGVVTTDIHLNGLDLGRLEHGHRQRVRKAARAPLDVVEGRTLEDLAQFRHLYRHEMRGLGAPQAGWRHFRSMHRHYHGFHQLLLARTAGRVVGGMLSVGDDRVMFSRRSATATASARSLNVSHALWWRALTDAAARGCHTYNCGMSWEGDHGLIRWKEAWGGVSSPIYVSSLPIRGEAPAPGSYFEGFRVAKAVWRMLPMPVVDVAGQIITRWVG